jgi:hypothetical protein
MKSRVVLSVLAVIGILALSATTAQAGSGGNPFPINSFFVCHPINADAPAPAVAVDVEGSQFGTNPQNVTIGQGILACVIAKLFNAGTGNEIDPNPGSVNQEGLKCYSFSSSRQSRKQLTPGVPETYTVTDAFGTDLDVQAGQLGQYICAPANFLLNSP